MLMACLRRGMEGVEGRAFSRLGLLALLVNAGIKDAVAAGFFELLGYRRIDLTRANFPELAKRLWEADLGRLVRVFVVADFVKLRGVPRWLSFGGGPDEPGTTLPECLMFAARAREACVGVVIAESRADCEREKVGVDGRGFPA